MILRRQAYQAANCRPDRNISGAGVFIINSAAPIDDAGILARRRLHSSALVPGHELGVDFSDLRLQLRIFFSLGREQLASQDGHALISLNAIEQRIDVRHPLAAVKAELGRIAADGVRQLRAIADQPIAQARPSSGPPVVRQSSPARSASSAGSSPRKVPRRRQYRSCHASHTA